MSEEVVDRGTLVHVHLQATVQEVLEVVRQVTFILNLRLAIGGDQIQSFEGRLREVGRFTLYHLYGHDAHAPDVNLKQLICTIKRRAKCSIFGAQERDVNNKPSLHIVCE